MVEQVMSLLMRIVNETCDKVAKTLAIDALAIIERAKKEGTAPIGTGLTDNDLIYAAHARCHCGAGMAYIRGSDPFRGFWDCSAILLGVAIPSGKTGSVRHESRLPFVFYEIKSENQPSANGSTTRPDKLTEGK